MVSSCLRVALSLSLSLSLFLSPSLSLSPSPSISIRPPIFLVQPTPVANDGSFNPTWIPFFQSLWLRPRARSSLSWGFPRDRTNDRSAEASSRTMHYCNPRMEKKSWGSKHARILSFDAFEILSLSLSLSLSLCLSHSLFRSIYFDSLIPKESNRSQRQLPCNRVLSYGVTEYKSD